MQEVFAETTASFVRRLREEKDTLDVTWRGYAESGSFGDMPPATIRDIYITGRVPLKWRRHYGLVVRVRPHRILVSTGNVSSAVRSLFGKRGIEKGLRDEFIRRVARMKTEMEY